MWPRLRSLSSACARSSSRLTFSSISGAPSSTCSKEEWPGWISALSRPGGGSSGGAVGPPPVSRSEEHTSELQSLMRTSYAVFCLKKQKITQNHGQHTLKRDINEELTTHMLMIRT